MLPRYTNLILQSCLVV